MPFQYAAHFIMYCLGALSNHAVKEIVEIEIYSLLKNFYYLLAGSALNGTSTSIKTLNIR